MSTQVTAKLLHTGNKRDGYGGILVEDFIIIIIMVMFCNYFSWVGKEPVLFWSVLFNICKANDSILTGTGGTLCQAKFSLI